MDGRGGAGEVVDLVDLHIEREGHVMAHQLKTLVVEKMFDIPPGAGEEIVDAQHFMAAGQQRLAQEGADKAGAAGNQNTLFHCQLLIQGRKIVEQRRQPFPTPGDLTLRGIPPGVIFVMVA